jgi:hypothetical protein
LRRGDLATPGVAISQSTMEQTVFRPRADGMPSARTWRSRLVRVGPAGSPSRTGPRRRPSPGRCLPLRDPASTACRPASSVASNREMPPRISGSGLSTSLAGSERALVWRPLEAVCDQPPPTRRIARGVGGTRCCGRRVSRSVDPRRQSADPADPPSVAGR